MNGLDARKDQAGEDGEVPGGANEGGVGEGCDGGGRRSDRSHLVPSWVGGEVTPTSYDEDLMCGTRTVCTSLVHAAPCSTQCRLGRAQMLRRRERSQRWARSPSIRGCQINEIRNGAIPNGSRKVARPRRNPPVCCSGTVAMRSVSRASAMAAAKPLTTTPMRRPQPLAVAT